MGLRAGLGLRRGRLPYHPNTIYWRGRRAADTRLTKVCTRSLIRAGTALPFTAHASPPTVTMPRIKALTTGSVPSFADLLFNLDESGGGSSSLATQDTWLAQIRARGGQLVFYGDDTWLRLFPAEAGFFAGAEGTSSFFVSVRGYSCKSPWAVSTVEQIAEYEPSLLSAGLHGSRPQCDAPPPPRTG